MSYGSDAHAESATCKFTPIGTCRERFLELAPKHWARTRARLDPNELAAFVSRFTVPSVRVSSLLVYDTAQPNCARRVNLRNRSRGAFFACLTPKMLTLQDADCHLARERS